MESVQVEILGQTYTIKGVADRDYIRELASFLDARMRDVQAGTGTADPHRIAILAAMNISDELFRLRARHEALEETSTTAAARFMKILDAAHIEGE
jgi:cell division protein ZapA